MTRLIYLLIFVLLSPAFKSLAQQKSSTANNAQKVRIVSTPADNPVLKRQEFNPLLCVKVYVPALLKKISVNSLKGTINPEAIKGVEKLDIFFNGNEPSFSGKSSTAAYKPAAATFSIPVDVVLTQGWNYIWISATLSQDADIDRQIEVHATALTDVNNRTYTVNEQPGSFKHYSGIALRKAGDDQVNSYRIPGIVATDKGTLLAVYDIRYSNDRDLPANIDVGLSRSTDGGKTWEPMKNIMDMGAPHENNGVGDPAILFDPVTKKIWVSALWSKGNRSIAGSEPGLSPDTTGQFVLVSSDDDGLTWSQPYSITTQVKNPIWHLYFNGPGNGIAMQNGTIVFASQYWDESKKPGLPHSAIVYSDDHGRTWKSGIGAKSNTTEAQVVETTPGTLMLNMRDNRGGFRSVATTTDMGKTWQEHQTSYNALPDPVCMASIIKARVNVKGVMRDVLFFSNANSAQTRNNITVKASLDLGESWLPANQLLLDGRRVYGYSALTKIDDHTLGLFYEGNRELYFVRVPVKDVMR